MTFIKTLYKRSLLSVRAYNVCFNESIATLDDLRKYYEKHKTFTNLDNCGSKTNDELVAILINQGDQPPTEVTNGSQDTLVQKNGLLIKQIFDQYDLSVRAFNVCNALNLVSTADLAMYYRKHGSFLAAKNCGKKTNDELVQLAKAEKSSQQVLEIDIAVPLLAAEDQVVYETLASKEFEKLSVRAKNALSAQLFDDGLPTYKNIHQHFLLNNVAALRIANVGVLTNAEIEQFKTFCRTLHRTIEGNDLDEIEKQRVKLGKICGFDVWEEKVVEHFSKRQMPLISFLASYLDRIFDLNEVEVFILKNALRLLDKKYTLDSMGQRFNLTRERIRQKRITVFKKLEVKHDFLRALVPHAERVKLPEGLRILSIDDIRKEHFLQQEIEKTSVLFTMYMLFILNCERYFLFSGLDKYRRPQNVEMLDIYEEIKRIRGCYLIDKTTISKKEFIELYVTVLRKHCERRNDTISLRWSELSDNITKSVVEVLATVVRKEFKIDCDLTGITLPRNTERRVFEYAREALESLSRPSHVMEIAAKIREQYPDFERDALSSAMQSRKDIFIYFGRSSTYGLKIWERSQKNIKGGTIRSIVAEYLNNFDEPKHVTEVLNFVRRFRNTNYNSVLSNLKLDTKNTFRFYGGGYIGITSKTYENSTFGVEVKNANDVDWEKIVDLVF